MTSLRTEQSLPSPGSPLPVTGSPSPGSRPYRIALVAGEASGDALGADLIEALRQRFPDAQFAGVGAAAMRAAGCQTWFDAGELSVMGLTEVLGHLPRLLSLRRQLRKSVLDWNPDVFIGIDAPDFNLGVERWLKQRDVRTVHYVSPSVWAWREKRAEKIGRSANCVLCLFPMEPPIYARHRVDARFVGHPMADAMPMEPDRAQARTQLGLPSDAPVLAVLPGSRLGEIKRLGEVFLQAAAQVAERIPGLQVVIPAANPACHAALEALLSDSRFPASRFRLFHGQAREAMFASNVVLLASGTATLEAALAKRPMVVGYRIAPLTYKIVKGLGILKAERYALPNVLANEDLAPELMQDDCTADNLARELLRWFKHPQAVAALLPKYERLHLSLRNDASAAAAKAIAGMISAHGA